MQEIVRPAEEPGGKEEAAEIASERKRDDAGVGILKLVELFRGQFEQVRPQLPLFVAEEAAK